MDELKFKLTEMFLWFHDFCETHYLRYYMVDGTMLGAARHQGFIPWDDDIDIGMPREDFERLEQLLLNHPNDRYVLETSNSEKKDFFYPFSKLYDTTTTLIENTRDKIKRGIYLDIFPLDGVCSDFKQREKHLRGIEKKYNLLLSRVTGIRNGRKWYKNLAVIALGLIPSCLLNNKKLLKSLTNDMKKYSYDECEFVGIVLSSKEVMLKEVMGSPTLYRFETIQVYGVENSDCYLTNIYGDWRKFPPEEKRKTHHDFISCDLNQSYLDN